MTVPPTKIPVDSNLTANGSAQDALAYNATRKSADITNLGSSLVYIAFGADAVYGQGKVIPPNCVGEINIETDQDTWMGDRVSVITDGTPCILTISEVTK